MRLEGAHAGIQSVLQRDHDRILAACSGADPAVTASSLFDVGPVSAALQVWRQTQLLSTLSIAFARLRADLWPWKRRASARTDSSVGT